MTYWKQHAQTKQNTIIKQNWSVKVFGHVCWAQFALWTCFFPFFSYRSKLFLLTELAFFFLFSLVKNVSPSQNQTELTIIPHNKKIISIRALMIKDKKFKLLLFKHLSVIQKFSSLHGFPHKIIFFAAFSILSTLTSYLLISKLANWAWND